MVALAFAISAQAVSSCYAPNAEESRGSGSSGRSLANSSGSSSSDPKSLSGQRQLVSGEAVEIAIAAGASQIALATAAIRPARGMRRVPRLGGGVVAQAPAIAMADHRGTLRAAGPVAAGPVLAWRESPAVSLRTSQNVMSGRYVVNTGDHGAAP